MKPKLAIVIVFLAAVGVILYIAVGRKSSGGDPPAGDRPRPVVGSAAAVPAGPEVEVPFEYSTEKKDWLEAAVAEFHKSHPRTRIKLIGKGSLEAATAILDGSDKPVLWSPADSLVAVCDRLASAVKPPNRPLAMFAAPMANSSWSASIS